MFFSESSAHFTLPLIVPAKECWYFYIKWFLPKMRLCYCAQLCGKMQGHLQLQSRVQPFDIAFAIKKFTFSDALYFKCILTWKRG